MKERIKETVIFTFVAAIIGIIIGALEALFGHGLTLVNEFRQSNIYIFIPLLALGGLLIAFCFKKFAKDCEKGMGLVFDVYNDKTDKMPIKLVPMMMGSTWVTHLFGGSGGREGVAVQIGAAVANRAGRFLPYMRSPKILLVAGVAAGFAGLFRTPFAAIAFALEIFVVGEIRYEALFPTIIAAFAAKYTSGLLGIQGEAFTLNVSLELDWITFAKITAISILFGLIGAAFAWFLRESGRVLKERLKSPYVRIFSVGILLSVVMILTGGRYSGSGTNLIAMCFEGEAIYWQDWIMKLVLTAITLAAGFKGGEVTPLFAIGATFGMLMGEIVGLPATLAAALGYSAVFASGTGTLLAPILVSGEVFGWEYMPLFIIACGVARVVNEWITIYPDQTALYKYTFIKRVKRRED